jgi:small subunit ribosomal protein S19
MSRAKWKGPYLNKSLFKNKKVLNVWSRSSVIPYSLLGKHVSVHNGKTLIRVYISREKVGYKFGEFVFTKKHTKKITKLKKIKK